MSAVKKGGKNEFMNNKRIILETLLADIKLEVEELKIFSNPVERMMKRYAKEIGDCEKSYFASQEYRRLGWKNYNTFDVAIPLWRTINSAMVERASRKGLEIKNKGKLLYVMPNNSIKYYVFNPQCGSYKYEYLSKKTLGEKYSKEKNIHREALGKVVESFPQIEEYCVMSDSIANFMPCPGYPYNSAKGTITSVVDYLPLMIDYIQRELNIIRNENKIDSTVVLQGKDFKVTAKDIKQWHKWFVKNRESCFLEDYYNIRKDESKQLIIEGIPLFNNQSLSNPLPESEEEIKMCLANQIKIINNRAIKMADKIILNKYGKIMDKLFRDGGESYALENLKYEFEKEGIVDENDFNEALEYCILHGWIIECGNGYYTR